MMQLSDALLHRIQATIYSFENLEHVAKVPTTNLLENNVTHVKCKLQAIKSRKYYEKELRNPPL